MWPSSGRGCHLADLACLGYDGLVLVLSKAPGAVPGAFGLLGERDKDAPMRLPCDPLARFAVTLELPEQVGHLAESGIFEG